MAPTLFFMIFSVFLYTRFTVRSTAEPMTKFKAFFKEYYAKAYFLALNITHDQNDKITDGMWEHILDMAEGTTLVSEEDLAALVNDASAREALHDIMLCDEAANARMGSVPDIDREWKHFTGRRRIYNKVYVMLAAAAALLAVIFVLWTTSRDQNVIYTTDTQPKSIIITSDQGPDRVLESNRMVCRNTER